MFEAAVASLRSRKWYRAGNLFGGGRQLRRTLQEGSSGCASSIQRFIEERARMMLRRLSIADGIHAPSLPGHTTDSTPMASC